MKKFIIRKLMAIAITILGIHLLVCYMQKVLLFGIVSNDMALWETWGYLGIWIALFAIVGGLYLLAKEFIERWIDQHLM